MSNLFIPFFGTELLRDEFKNLSNSLAFVLMVNFLPILSTLEVDERDFVSSSLMSVLRDSTSACSCVI